MAVAPYVKTTVFFEDLLADECRGTSLAPYLINAFDLVINFTQDKDTILEETKMQVNSYINLFMGNLTNLRIDSKMKEEAGEQPSTHVWYFEKL